MAWESVEKNWSGAVGEHASEDDTGGRLPTKVPTSLMSSGDGTSLELLVRLGPWVLATLESLVGLLATVLSPIFSKLESGSDRNATWCTGESHKKLLRLKAAGYITARKT